MKPTRTKEFSVMRKLKKKVKDMESRIEELENILIQILEEKKQWPLLK